MLGEKRQAAPSWYFNPWVQLVAGIVCMAMIAGQGYGKAFLYFGIGQGIVVVVLSLILAAPHLASTPQAAAQADGARSYTWTEMIRSPIFWVMYAMFVLVGAGGLMATA